MSELLEFLKTHKKWWLAPTLVVIALIVLLLLMAQSSPLGPFVYTRF